ncbi:MAG: DUF952 domain-containing protein [Pseudomonadota bacterium]
MLIYKILRAEEWAGLDASGVFEGSPADLADGFIHLSAADQVAGTAAKHFAGEAGLMLVAVEADGLGELRWEPSRGGALFPHLYRALKAGDVVWAKPLPDAAALKALP